MCEAENLGKNNGANEDFDCHERFEERAGKGVANARQWVESNKRANCREYNHQGERFLHEQEAESGLLTHEEPQEAATNAGAADIFAKLLEVSSTSEIVRQACC